MKKPWIIWKVNIQITITLRGVHYCNSPNWLAYLNKPPLAAAIKFREKYPLHESLQFLELINIFQF